MQTFSKYFNLDVIDTNQTLKPILVISEPTDNTVLFTLALDQDKLLNNNGDEIEVINSIQKVSNVKSSNDFDSKKLKINTLRCTLYNYYDNNTRLSEYINTGILNKNIYLFYKSPTTNKINFTGNISDYDCALIFSGEISRIKFNDKTLELTAEDKTQIIIADKTVPYMSIDKLNTDISNNILPHYNNENITVPMTYGSVNKAPVLPYYEKYNNKTINLLLDVQPTAGNFKTSKIPGMLNSSPNTTLDNYCLYIKDNNDYLIFSQNPFTIVNQYNHYSKFKITSLSGFSNDQLLPDVGYSASAIFNLWDTIAYSQRLVDSAYTSDGSIMDVLNITSENLNNSNYINIDSIYNNADKRKIWYRASDNIISGNLNFNTGLKSYDYNDNSGIGRWIVLKLEDGVSHNLINQQIDGEWAGNTFLLSDYKIYQNEQNSDYNYNTIGNVSTGFMVAPIVPEIWNDLISTSSQTNDEDWKRVILGLMLLQRRDQFEEAKDLLDSDLNNSEILTELMNIGNDDGWMDDNDKQNAADWYHSVIDLHYNDLESGDSAYWGSYGTNNGLNLIKPLTKIQGMFYGDKGNSDRQILSARANEYNNIAIFEYHLNKGNSNDNYRSGLEINNTSFLQSCLVENLNQKNIYASIVGRRNNFYTEELNVETANLFPDNEISLDLDYYFEGLDENKPSVSEANTIVDEIINITGDTFDEFLGEYTNNITGATTSDNAVSREQINDFVNGENWVSILSSNWQNTNISDDSPLLNNYSFFKEFIWKQILIPAKLFYNWGAELDSAEFIATSTSHQAYDWLTLEELIADQDHQNYISLSEQGMFDDLISGDYEDAYFLSNSPNVNPDSQGLLADNLIRTADNYKNLFKSNNSPFIKKFLLEILSYLYQKELDPNYTQYELTYISWEFVGNYLKYSYWPQDQGNQFPDLTAMISGDIVSYGIQNDNINFSSNVNSKRQFHWDSFGNMETLEEFKNNFYLYMDDLTQAISESLMETIGERHNESYNSFTENYNDLSDYAASLDYVFESTLDNIPEYDLYNPFWIFTGNMNEWAEQNSWVLGIGNSDPNNTYLDSILNDITNLAISNLTPEESIIEGSVTDGVIQKPSDIVMNILVNEIGFSKYGDESIGNVLLPEYSGFDLDSINLSREIHNGWQMGFSINKKTNGKKLIEEILKESKSYPMFTSDGKFSLITIKEKYIYDDIDIIIDEQDIIKYTFNQTKREDILTSVKMFYRYDYGLKKYDLDIEKNITDILPDYQGYDYYNINSLDTHKDINLKYHTDSNTVDNFLDYTLLNSCNPHNEVVLELPLKYINLTVGDVIHLPLINNEKIFNLDYSKVEILNAQPIYPLWIILATDIGSKSIKIKAYQLHYLGVDGDHGFVLPDESYEIVGNMNQFNTKYKFTNGNSIPNWNFNPDATIDNGIEIPYFDLTGDGQINMKDITLLTDYLYGYGELTLSQKQRLKYKSDGSYIQGDNINIISLASIVSLITG